MKHKIRINGEVQELDCEIGSGVLDDKGNEIFEGDCVQTTFAGLVGFDRAYFKNGAIYIGVHPLDDIISWRLDIAND